MRKVGSERNQALDTDNELRPWHQKSLPVDTAVSKGQYGSDCPTKEPPSDTGKACHARLTMHQILVA